MTLKLFCLQFCAILCRHWDCWSFAFHSEI